MLATVSRWGNSLGIRIPASLAEASGIAEGDKVELRRTLNGDIILQRKKKERGELKGFGQLRQYYLLRYILDDIPEQSEMAVEAIRAGASTYAEVIPEVVYVLDKVYRIGRNEVASAIANMLEDVHVDHADVILGALELYARTGLDYVDCLMLSGFREEGNDFLSFDKKLMKMKQRL